MKTVQGKPVSPGYAQGRAALVGVGEITAPERRIAEHEIDREIQRFRTALDESRRDLLRLQERVQSELGSAEAEIFSAHLLFLKDPQFIERVERSLRQDRLGIEAAIAVTVTELVNILSQSDNAYLRERSEDIRDLGQRLLRNLTRLEAGHLGRQEPGTVLVARELLPSDLIEIDRDHLVGIITELGGETGHAAILARGRRDYVLRPAGHGNTDAQTANNYPAVDELSDRQCAVLAAGAQAPASNHHDTGARAMRVTATQPRQVRQTLRFARRDTRRPGGGRLYSLQEHKKEDMPRFPVCRTRRGTADRLSMQSPGSRTQKTAACPFYWRRYLPVRLARHARGDAHGWN